MVPDQENTTTTTSSRSSGAQRGGRRGRSRSSGDVPTTAAQREQIAAWFAGRLPQEWFTTVPMVTVDGDEILVVGNLQPVDLEAGATEQQQTTAEAARISGHREDTREHRIRIADEAQQTFGRIVSWGATCGGSTYHFTSAAVPVMTRLRINERQVLDTLIDAGVARSRSEALAWCVQLVGRNEDEWIGELRAAFEHVDSVRAKGPRSGQS